MRVCHRCHMPISKETTRCARCSWNICEHCASCGCNYTDYEKYIGRFSPNCSVQQLKTELLSDTTKITNDHLNDMQKLFSLNPILAYEFIQSLSPTELLQLKIVEERINGIDRYSDVCDCVQAIVRTEEKPDVDALVDDTFIDDTFDALEVGDLINFGTYLYKLDQKSGERLLWEILDIDHDIALLLLVYGLEYVPYNITFSPVTWETCSLRHWLNTIFLMNSFSDQEMSIIVDSSLENTDNSAPGVTGDMSVKDKVFIHTVEEVEKFKNPPYLCPSPENAKLSGFDVQGNCAWWLRSTGDADNMAVYIDPYGMINRLGFTVDECRLAVRPAMRIHLAAG